MPLIRAPGPGTPTRGDVYKRQVLELQGKWSAVPGADELLVERLATREGRTRYSHLFVYPFAGKLVHQGLAALAAWRLSRARPITFTLTANDYGFELLAPERDAFAELDVPALFSTDNLLDDIVAGLNESEICLLYTSRCSARGR